MKPTFLYLTIVTLAICSFVACSDKTEATTNTEEAIVVRTQPVQVSDYASSLQYSGKLASTSEANLSFKVGGVVSHIYVKEGDHVSRGQVLATLDLTEINAQVQQAKQGAEKAARDYTRIKNLFADTAATLEQLQNVETAQKVANEGLRIASFNQQYAQIRATANGTITKKIMNEGELASPGTPVLALNATSDNDWVVRFGVSDKDWALLKKGDFATVSIDAYPAENFKGVINKTAQTADGASGTYEMEVKVMPEGKKFAAGLFATVQLNTTAKQKVTLIPIEAFTEGNGKTGYVYLLNKDNKTVTKRRVEIAFITDGKVAVKTGLENVSSVLTDGVSYLTEDAKVIVAKAQAL